MKPRVQQKLDQLRGYPFFESVGKPLPDSVTQIENWRMAAKECGKPRWDNSRLMARNALQSAIQNQFPKAGMWERMQEWNPVVEELRPSIDSLADSLTVKVPLSEELKLRVKQSL